MMVGVMNNQTHPPDFIRLPKSGARCPYTGLSRSTLYELLVPSKRNGYRPPVKSKHIRRPGAMRGIRLIYYPSLISYLVNQEG